MRVWIARGCTALLITLGLATGAGAVVPRFEPIGEPGAVRDNVVSALAIDARGLLWAGSPEGLLRFDGYAFRRYPLSAPDGQLLSEQFVRALLPDPRGWMWLAAGNSGLVRMDLATGQWARWARDGKSADETAPAANTVRTLALEKDGTLWIGGSGGLDRFDVKRDRFTHHRGPADGLPDPRVQTLLVDRQGTLWIGTWRGLARKAVDGPIETLDVGLGDQLVTLLAETLDGRVIAGTAQGRLRALSPAGQPLPFSDGTEPGAGASVWPVMAMAQPDNDELWFGDSSGVSRRRASDGSLIERLPASGGGSAPRSDVRALMRDPSGTVWAGSYGGGLMRHVPPLPGFSMVRETVGPAAPLDVRSVLQLSNGEVWLGTLAGGIEKRDRLLRPIGHIGPVASGHGGLPPGRVNALGQTKDGSVWVAVDTQLLRFDDQGRWKETLRSGNAVPRRFQAGADGALWIATLDGILRWTPEHPQMRPIATAGLVGGTGEVNAFATLPDGSLWAGGAAGLFRVAKPGADEPVAEWVETQGLTGQTVLGMAVDLAGRLWVDAGTGLHRMVDGDGKHARFEAVGASEVGGAFGANLLFDKAGRIWSQRNMYDPRSGEHRELGAADGADLGTGWFRAYAQLDDGRMLFGGARGLLVIDAERFSPWTYKPPLVASELRVEGEERPLPGTKLVLAPGERGFSLAFTSLDYSQPGRNRYRYRLEGLDHGWTTANALSRTATYTNLSPGHYRLQVQGSNRDGAWGANDLVIDVDVRAAWWQTLWAKVLAVLAMAAAVFAVVRMRTRLLLRRQRVLEAAVHERTQALEAATAALGAKSIELEEASLTDPLTGLRNRRFLDRQMPADVALAVRHYEPIAAEPSPGDSEQDLLFFLVDLDHFKRINDAHGHMAGDLVLAQMRGRLEQVFRATDYLVRWGGEEFLIVARGTPRSRAAEVAERARQAVAAQPFELDGGFKLSLSCSVGFCAFPLSTALPGALDWHAAIDLADAALYEAKDVGRNAWVGLLSAQAASADELREDARRGLDAWAATGRLQRVASNVERRQPA